MQRIHVALLGEDFLAENLHPALLGVLHHGGVLVGKAAAVGAGPLDLFAVLIHHLLAQEALLLLHELGNLLADIYKLAGSAVTGDVIPAEIVVVLALGGGQGGDADAGVGTQVDVGVEAVIIDVGEDPGPLPDGAAAGVEGEEHLLLKHGLDLDLHPAAHGHGEADGQLHPDAVAALKVLEHLARGHGGRDGLVGDLGGVVPGGGAAAHRRAVGIGSGEGHRLHAQVIAQGLEAVGLQGQGGEVPGGLIHKAALLGLTDQVVLNGLALLVGEGDFLVLGAVEVHGRHDLVLRGVLIDDGAALAVCASGDADDLAVAGAGGGGAEAAGVEGQVVARICGGQGVKAHGGILVAGEVQHLTGHGDGVVGAVPVGVRVGGDGQNVRSEEDVLTVGGLVAVAAAVGSGDFHIGDSAVAVRAQGGKAPPVGALTGVDGHQVAHGEGGAGVSKDTGALHLLDGGLAGGVLGEGDGEQAVQVSGRVGHVSLGDVLHPAIQLQVVNRLLFGDDVEYPDAGGLLTAIYIKDGRGVLRELHPVGLAGGEGGGDSAAGDGVAHGLVAGGDVDEGGDAALCVAGDAEGVARHGAGLYLNGDVVGRLLLGHGGDVAHLGVEGDVAYHGVLGEGGVGHGLVIVPAQEHPALLIGGGDGGELGAHGVELGLRQGDARGVHAGAQRRRYLIVYIGVDRGGCGDIGRAGGGGLGGLQVLGGVYPHPVGGDAGLAVPGVHRLVGAHAQRRGLAAGGIALGVEVLAIAAQQPFTPELHHGVLGVEGHPFKVGGGGLDVGAGGVADTHGLKVTHEEHGHLLPGDKVLGGEFPVPGAGGDAVFGGPLHIGGVVGVGGHVGKVGIAAVAFRLDARHAAQHRDEHAPGHGSVRGEGRLAGAVEEAVGHGVEHRAVEPIGGFHIGEGIGHRCALPLGVGLGRQYVHRQHGREHAQREQKADNAFSHFASSP